MLSHRTDLARGTAYSPFLPTDSAEDPDFLEGIWLHASGYGLDFGNGEYRAIFAHIAFVPLVSVASSTSRLMRFSRAVYPIA